MIHYEYILYILTSVNCNIVYNEIDNDFSISNALWKSASPFIEGRYANTILTKDKSLQFGYNVLSCGIAHFGIIFRYYYLEPSEFLKEDDKSIILNSKSSSFSLIVSQNFEASSKRLFLLSRLNNNIYIIQVYFNETLQKSKQALVIIWKKFKAMNIILYRLSDNKKYIEAMFYDPFVIKNNKRGYVYIIKLPDELSKVEDFWYTFNRRLDNVDGYPLRICIFGYPGTSLPILGKNNTLIRYKLRDGNLIGAIAKTMNFSPVYFTPTDGKTYGGELENGTLLGAILDISNGEADILGNIRPIRLFRTINVEFLFPADEMKFTFLVPKIEEDFVVSFVRIYDITTSLALFATFISTTIIWYVLQRANFQIGNIFGLSQNFGDLMNFEDLLQLIFGIMLLVSQKGRQKIFERCLFIALVLFSMITSYTYQAKMVERLSASRVSQDIKSAEELSETDLKVITVYGFRDMLKDIAEEDESGVYEKLYRRQELSDDVTENLRRVGIQRDSALLWSDLSSRLYSLKMYSNSTGVSLFHIVKGPPTRYNAHIVPGDCPYQDRFNKILMKIRESGLVLKWKDDFYQSLIIETLKRTYETKQLNVYTMDELNFIFVSLLTCDCICFAVFLAEIFVYRCAKYKHKHYVI